jgi:UDP-N-acetylmuramoyl-L-alanyl-D-glutamate--2,6-diaminopimelate ligase
MGFSEFVKRPYHWLIPHLADWYYGRPGKKLIVIGVTGTKGKSSTCRFIASVLEAGGYKVGLMTTVEFQIGEERFSNTQKMSMLGKGQIQKMLARMVKAGCEYAVVETSSQGILQYRHVGVHYDIAVFTNLGHEHVEAHGSFENLRRDKGKLFASLENEPPKKIKGTIIPKINIVNTDDAEAHFFGGFTADQHWSYGLKKAEINPEHHIQGVGVAASSQGVDFKVGEQLYHLNILGEFNVPNALAAITVGLTQGIAPERMREGLASVRTIAGRMDFVQAGQPFKVVVDYAHEPMSLNALFTALKTLVGPEKKVIAVVGSDGGGRDKGKRFEMGRIAGALADVVVR